MIKEKIKVEWYEEKKTGRIVFETSLEDWLEDKFYEKERIFHTFKNNGKVSKTDCHRRQEVNEEAERLLAERLQIKKETPEDEKRAMKLVRIIEKAIDDMPDGAPIHWDVLEKGNFNDRYTPGWVTIKAKTSRSKWYENEGFGHMPSVYHYQVPKSVENEAKELRKIRKKHTGDSTFNFFRTDCRYRLVREADHSNLSACGRNV